MYKNTFHEILSKFLNFSFGDCLHLKPLLLCLVLDENLKSNCLRKSSQVNTTALPFSVDFRSFQNRRNCRKYKERMRLSSTLVSISKWSFLYQGVFLETKAETNDNGSSKKTFFFLLSDKRYSAWVLGLVAGVIQLERSVQLVVYCQLNLQSNWLWESQGKRREENGSNPK